MTNRINVKLLKAKIDTLNDLLGFSREPYDRATPRLICLASRLAGLLS